MADVHRASDAPGVSYKDKLLQASEHDELSHLDQAPKPKLPPTKDEGSPPMTIKVPEPQAQAPAGADDTPSPDLRSSSWPHGTSSDRPEALRSGSLGTPWSPKGSTQSAIDARHRFRHSKSGRQASVKADYVLKEGAVPCCPQPQHVDDYPSDEDVPQPEGWEQQESKAPAAGADTGAAPKSAAGDGESSQESAQISIAEAGPSTVAGTTLSDIEQQVISEPSTADLVAAATQSDTELVNPSPPKANVVVVQPDDSSDVRGMQGDVSAVLPAGGSAAGTPIVTEADTAAGKVSSGGDNDSSASVGGSGSGEKSSTTAKRAQSTIGGEILGMPIRIREASDAAGLSMKLPEEPEDVDRNAPGKAFGMETEATSGSRRSSDSSANRADSLFTGGGRIFTASDAAAAGLADLEAEADAAAESGKQEGGTSGDTMDDSVAAEAAGEGGTLGDTAAGGTAGGTMGGTFGATPGDTHSEAPGDTAAAGDTTGGTVGDAVPSAVDFSAVSAPDTPDSNSEVGAASSAADAVQEDDESAVPGSTAAREAVPQDAQVAEGGGSDTKEKHNGRLNPLKAVGAAISKVADMVVGRDTAADMDLPGADADSEEKQQASSEAAKEVGSHPVLNYESAATDEAAAEAEASKEGPAPFAVL